MSRLLIACLVALAGPAAGERSPFSRLGPSGTSWAAEGIDYEELRRRPDDRVVVEFDAAGKYTITGSCQIVITAYPAIRAFKSYG